MKRWSIGLLGCGNIIERYVEGLRRYPHLRIAWCADIDLSRAEQTAALFEIPKWGRPEEMLADQEVQVVVNLTPPSLHARVISQALRAGKHVYTEKPLATTVQDASELISLAGALDRGLGSAPDTFLGSAGQTARHAIDRALIGQVIGASAFIRHNRMERRHPDPTFLFRPGGGPVLDLGPYYITALVNCLGPVSRVAGMTRIGARSRTVTAPNRLVEAIDVQVPTHATALLEFASGVIGTVIMSFDIWATTLPFIEIYGTEGTLAIPNPVHFDGEVLVADRAGDWQVLPAVEPPGSLRGIGVADLVGSLEGQPHRANPQLSRHVLEVLLAIQQSSDTSEVIEMITSCDRPPISQGSLTPKGA